MLRNPVWPRAGLFAMLTIGAATAWGFVVVCCVEFWDEYFGGDQLYIYEQLVVDADGTPLIYSNSYDPKTPGWNYRTLDGETRPRQSVVQLAEASLPWQPDPPDWTDGPIRWNERLWWSNDAQQPMTMWYLIRDRTDRGLCYFEAYDAAAKRRVGYLGRNGFRRSVPQTDEQFQLGPRRWLTVGTVVGMDDRRGYGYRTYADNSAVKQVQRFTSLPVA